MDVLPDGRRRPYRSGWDGWDRLREALSELELWPLLAGKRGEEEDVRVFARSYPHNVDRSIHNIEAVLARGLALSPDAWLQERDGYAAQWRAEHEAYLASPQHQVDLQAQREYEGLEALEDEEFLANSFADEPEPQGSPWHEDEPQVLEEPLPQAVREFWLFLVPARHSWEVPAVLCFGGWNACPEPHEHVALLHGWHQKHGAQLIGWSHDTMLFHVARPPQNYEDALLLAHQQFYEVAQSAPLLAAGMNGLEEGTDSMSVSSSEVLEVGGGSMPPSTSCRGR